ncbi:MAG: peroxiredoxin [Methanotrichaceae archaeon]|nr:peroxiredoxin [Methanotrichaceae archaeon]
MLIAGEAAPDFCLQDDDLQEACLHSYLGRWLVLYFYPRDNTSGCTREALDFTAAKATFQVLGADVVAISPDSSASHRKFREKHDLKIRLLSDSDHEVMEAYDVWAKKKTFGRESYGVLRSTFLIDPNGDIARIWRSVKVKGHVDEVIETLKALKRSV